MIYLCRPAGRTAREAWDCFTLLFNVEPDEMSFHGNAWCFLFTHPKTGRKGAVNLLPTTDVHETDLKSFRTAVRSVRASAGTARFQPSPGVNFPK